MTFKLADYAIFAVTLVLSASVGIYYAIKDVYVKRKRARVAGKTVDNTRTGQRQNAEKAGNEGTETQEFVMGGRHMPILPVTLSVLTTFMSGIMLLAGPAEIYQRGLLFWIFFMSCPVALLVCAVFFLPIFFRLRSVSIYEYFQRRFGSLLLRRIACALFLLNSVFYMAVVMFAPAISFSGVTGVPTWPLILSVGAVCTFYTTLGGLKAVVWTDSLQAVFMYAGVFSLVIKGTIDSGGISEVFRIASESGRIDALKRIDPNPAQYLSLWIASFGGMVTWFGMYGLNQMAMQRYCSMPTIRHARIVIGFTFPAYVIMSSLCSFIGLVALAYFFYCNPLRSGDIKSPDQIVIYLVTKTLGTVPGLPGLFLACLFSGTLSTVSSGINSMAAVTYEDFIKQRFGKRLSDRQTLMINRILCLIYGIVSTGLAFAAGPMGGIMKTATNMMGSFGGPLVGLFLLGIFFPLANLHGALVGIMMSVAFGIWLALGMISFSLPYMTTPVILGNVITKPYAGYFLPFNDSQCSATVLALPYPNSTILEQRHYGDPNVFWGYRISNYAYPLIGAVLTVGIGLLVSAMWPIKGQTDDEKHAMRELTVFGGKTRTGPSKNHTRKSNKNRELSVYGPDSVGKRDPRGTTTKY